MMFRLRSDLASKGRLALISIVAAGCFLAAPASAQTVVFDEQFETGNAAAAVPLGGYNGYTADAWWLNYAECNGVIVRYNGATFSTGQCDSASATDDAIARRNVRRLADVLGQVAAGVVGSNNAGSPANGSTGVTQNNHAVSAWTIGGITVSGPANAIQFQTGLMNFGSGGYYTARVDVAEASCTFNGGANNSRLTFFLVPNGGAAIQMNSSPIRACTDTRATYYTSPLIALQDWGNGGTSVRAGRFFSDNSIKLTAAQAASVRVRMTNASGASAGNDAAIDNINVVNVTPTIAKSFAVASIVAGGTTQLTFTVSNPAGDTSAKLGWRFTDTFPTGMTLANTTVGGTCRNYAGTAGTTATLVGASAGAASVQVDASLPAVASCTVIVNVQVAATTTASQMQNCAANFSNVEFLNPPTACATIDILRRVRLGKTWADATAGNAVSLAISGAGVSSAVAGSSTAPSTVVQATANATVGSTVSLTEAFTSGSAANYDSTVACVKDIGGATVTVTPGALTGSIVMPNDSDVTCAFTNQNRIVDLRITKTNTPGSGPNDLAGDVVAGGTDTTYTIVVTNAGPGSVTGAIVRDTPVSGITCPAGNPVTITGNGVPAGAFTVADLTGAGIALAALANGQNTTLVFTCTVN